MTKVYISDTNIWIDFRNADLLAESIVLSAEHLHAQVRIDFAGLERKTH